MSKKNDKTRQAFLLTFFDEDKYTELELNGFWLVKHYSGNTHKWQVAIYTPEAFKKYSTFRQRAYNGEHSLWKD